MIIHILLLLCLVSFGSASPTNFTLRQTNRTASSDVWRLMVGSSNTPVFPAFMVFYKTRWVMTAWDSLSDNETKIVEIEKTPLPGQIWRLREPSPELNRRPRVLGLINDIDSLIHPLQNATLAGIEVYFPNGPYNPPQPYMPSYPDKFVMIQGFKIQEWTTIGDKNYIRLGWQNPGLSLNGMSLSLIPDSHGDIYWNLQIGGWEVNKKMWDLHLFANWERWVGATGPYTIQVWDPARGW